MSSSTPAFEPLRITVVDSEACHFCEDAHRALATLAASYPLAVDTLTGEAPQEQVRRRTEHRLRREGGQPWVTC